MDGPAQRTLTRALELMGTTERLAQALETPLVDVENYLREGKVPDPVFFKALDIVARAPHFPKE